MQRRINEHGSTDIPLPKSVTEGEVPEKPNAYPDGSVKNPKDANWRIGGAGVWWPGRLFEPASNVEATNAEENEEAAATDEASAMKDDLAFLPSNIVYLLSLSCLLLKYL